MTFTNHSPWVEQLDDSIDYPALSTNKKADIVVIGGGISGVSTAFQILTQTELTVSLIEAKKIARGATGHNAGQVVLYFEKPFQEIVREYGLPKAIDGQKALFRGFDILQEMMERIDILDHLQMCEGFMAIRSMEELSVHLENKYLRDTGWAQFDAIFVDKQWEYRQDIAPQFRDLITFVDASYISEKLETKEYFPVLLTSKKACTNSAFFCQKAVEYLVDNFPHRFSVYEHSPVTEIRFCPESDNQVWAGEYRIDTQDVILCTNWFEHFHIVDLCHPDSRERDRIFHKNVHGLVGYMAWFFTDFSHPSAISYFPEPLSDVYFYLTRRTVQDSHSKKSLVCIGWPDSLVPHDMHYDEINHDPKEAYSEIRDFLKQYRTETLPKDFDYKWHGLMGYTHTGLRYIGQDPNTHHLWYNLGCNGVGIVWSAYGGWKIAKILSWTSFASSIFDPE
jgi:glycine/D-amino acid oxidase-like deaminating enzyme